jgi:uncharacterized protein YjiS (DUF1127 family)
LNDFHRRELRAERGIVFKLEANMVDAFFESSAAKALWRVLTWPARVGAARRTMLQLAGMSEYELRDIGLTRSDINDATALPLDADPSGLLVRRRAWRERSIGERTHLAA